MQITKYVAVWIISLSAAAPFALATNCKTPHWERVTLVPVSIEAQNFDGAPMRADVNWISHRLSLAATEQATRSLTKHCIVGIVEQGSTTPTGVTMISRIRLPLTLPSNQIGFRASQREGTFATAEVIFKDAKGMVLASESVDLKWVPCAGSEDRITTGAIAY